MRRKDQKQRKGIKFQRECVYLFSIISSALEVLSKQHIILVPQVFIKLYVLLQKNPSETESSFSGEISVRLLSDSQD